MISMKLPIVPHFFTRRFLVKAILLKVWDSHGETALADDKNEKDRIPATFSFHTAFSDDNAPANCPKRESIECRLIAVY
jgi:hypothetical protein